MNLEASLPAAALTTWPGLEFPYKVFMPLCVHHPVAKFHISNQVFTLGSNSVQGACLYVTYTYIHILNVYMHRAV